MGKIGYSRVLIIDDTQIGAFVTSEILYDERLDAKDISIAQSALSAMFQFGRENYDLVICNARLETMSGFELINMVRSGGITVPFILLREAEESGQDDGQDEMVISILDRRSLTAGHIFTAVKENINTSHTGSGVQKKFAEAW